MYPRFLAQLHYELQSLGVLPSPKTIPWSADLELSPALLDGDHQRLLQQVNALLLCLPSRDDRRIERAYRALVNCAKEHFADEEIMMRKYRYSGVARHAGHHEALLRRLTELQRTNYRPYGDKRKADVQRFLENWLVPHIVNDDQRFTEFLDAAGHA